MALTSDRGAMEGASQKAGVVGNSGLLSKMVNLSSTSGVLKEAAGMEEVSGDTNTNMTQRPRASYVLLCIFPGHMIL